MLRIEDRRTGAVRDLYVIDAHHHIGEEADGKKNIPIGNNGSYQVSKKLKTDVIDKLSDTTHRYKVILESEEDENDYPYGLFDQFVVFPMKDHYRDEGEYTYTKSNQNIFEWISSDYHKKRLLGFGRVDPSNIEKARKEVKKFTSRYGFLGLKIHPKSEKIDLDSREIVQLYIDCTKFNIPIIFHTDYPSDVKEIHRGVNKTINILIENKLEEYISQLKVIIGHHDYINHESFRHISHPSIYAELSGLKSGKEFIEKAKGEICLSKFTNQTIDEFDGIVKTKLKDHFWELFDISTNWSSKIMIGTDHPFLPVENIVNLFEDLFDSELSEQLTLSEIQRILGRNLVDILQVNCRMKPSVVIKNKLDSKVSHLNKKEEQIDYFLGIIKNLDEKMPVNSLKKYKNIYGWNLEGERTQEHLSDVLIKARKAEILAKMLDENDNLDPEVIDEIYDYCEKDQYKKGIKILKEV